MTTPISSSTSQPSPPPVDQTANAETSAPTPSSTDQATPPTPSSSTASSTTAPVNDDGTAQSPESDAARTVGTQVDGWAHDLADDHDTFHKAMQRSLGDAYDHGAVESLRSKIADGDASWRPEVSFASDDTLTEATLRDGRIVLPASLRDRPAEATRQAAAVAVGAFAEAAGLDVPAGGIDGAHFAKELDPAQHGELSFYLAQPSADAAPVPDLFASAGLEYTSTPVHQAPVSIEGIDRDYVAAWIGTPPEVGEMDDGGIANMLNPEWRKAVTDAARLNGGLGNSEDGFLAFSKKYGFVRLRNPRLSPEQNRRLAEMSLTLGAPIEKMPSRAEESAFLKPNIDKWVNEIIGRYDTEMAAFRADPTDGISVSDGRKRYKLEFNEEAGRFVSYDYKKSGGLKGFVQKNMKYISPVLDAASLLVNVIPGVGQAASFAIAAGSQALKTAAQVIATGKLAARQVAGLVTSFLPQIGAAFNLTKTQVALAGGVTNATAQYIDTGKIDFEALAKSAAPSLISGLPGGAAVDSAVQKTVILTAGAIQDGKIDVRDALSVINSIASAVKSTRAAGAAAGDAKAGASAPPDDGFFDGLRDTVMDRLGLDRDTVSLLEKVGRPIAKAVARGEFEAADIAKALTPLAERMTENEAAQRLIKETIGAVAGSIDAGRIDAETALDKLLPAFIAAFEEPAEAKAAA